MEQKKKITFGKIILTFFEIVLLAAVFSLLWATKRYGGVQMNAIMFSLFMPMVGISTGILSDYFSYMAMTFLPTLMVVVAIVISCKKLQNGPYKINKVLKSIVKVMGKMRFVVIIWLLATLLTIAEHNFGLVKWVSYQFQTSNFIEEEYVDPKLAQVTFPKEKRNLIYIIVESAETTNQSVQDGGVFDYDNAPEMTQLAYSNISFSQNDKLTGAYVAPYCTWSMSAIIAQTSGVPTKTWYPPTKNANGEFNKFMPGVTTLGEILEQNGYKNYFMAGSDSDFACCTEYLTQHGNYTLLDYPWAVETGRITSDYFVWWGFEDQKLYSYAKEELTNIAQNDEPFNFTLMTVDTHCEDGYICELCSTDEDNQYKNVWNCASKQLNEFVEWIKEQPFYENTTVVIVGDHCSMDVNFYDGLAATEDRRVYNCIINSAVKTANTKNRQFTTMDMFPTTLASIGAIIEGDRLGLGTNLFSDTKTLVEQYEASYVFDELEKVSQFYNNNLSH